MKKNKPSNPIQFLTKLYNSNPFPPSGPPGSPTFKTMTTLNDIRKKISDYQSLFDYETSIFWSVYVFEITEGLSDLYILLENLILARQFNRCLCYLPISNRLFSRLPPPPDRGDRADRPDRDPYNTPILPLKFRLLFAHCHYKTKKYEAALELLQTPDQTEMSTMETVYNSAAINAMNVAATTTNSNKESNKENIFFESSMGDSATINNNNNLGHQAGSAGLVSSSSSVTTDLKQTATSEAIDPSTAMVDADGAPPSTQTDPKKSKLKTSKTTSPGSEAKPDQNEKSRDPRDEPTATAHDPQSVNLIPPQTLAKKYTLLSEIYDILQNPIAAFENLRLAITCDPFCASAWEKIKRKKYLSNIDERNFTCDWDRNLSCIAFENFKKTRDNKKSSCGDANSYSGPPHPTKVQPYEKTSVSKINLATSYFNQQKINKAYEITKPLITQNSFNWNVLPLHLAILTELGSEKSTELFKISHTLMDNCPTRSLSWYAVGCYYFTIKQMKKARQNFARATEFQNDEYICLHSWIAYGHSFAKSFEHDQALAAYIQASQLMPFIHEPNLFIGMQHLANKNYKLAEEYFNLALEQSCMMAGSNVTVNMSTTATTTINGTLSLPIVATKNEQLADPFVLSELGYTFYLQGNYQKAEKTLKQAISGYKGIQSSYKEGSVWASVLINLGHTCRKLKKYNEAINSFEKAIILDPNFNEDCYINLAVVYLHIENFTLAIEFLENAININGKNEISKLLLQDAMELWCLEVSVARDEALDVELEFKGETEEDCENCLMANQQTTPFMDESQTSKASTSIKNSSNLRPLEENSGEHTGQGGSGPPRVNLSENISQDGTDMSLEEDSLNESSF